MSALAMLGHGLSVIGGVIFVLAAIGLWRFRDPYTRISAVATAAGLGVSFVVVGTLLVEPSVVSGLKVALAVALQLLTSAVAGMVVARSAVLSGQSFVDTDSAALEFPEAPGGADEGSR